MARLRDVHARYGSRPFSTAVAVGDGMGRRVMSNRNLRAPVTGVRVASEAPTTFAARALEALPILRPGERFSHAAALALWGCPIRVQEDAPVDVECLTPMRPMRRRGVRGHSATLGSSAFTPLPQADCTAEPPPPGSELLPAVSGAPVVTPARALRQAAGELPFPELVVACDHILRLSASWDVFGHAVAPGRVPSESLAVLHPRAEQTRGRGVRRVRLAAQLAREGAESRMETLTRLQTVAVGITGLELQAEIRDSDGLFLARVDLLDRRSRTVLEYDGEQHRLDRRQYLRDLDRLDRLRDAGWRVLRVHAEQVLAAGNPVGAMMLAQIARPAERVPAEIARLLEERWHVPTIRAN